MVHDRELAGDGILEYLWLRHLQRASRRLAMVLRGKHLCENVPLPLFFSFGFILNRAIFFLFSNFRKTQERLIGKHVEQDGGEHIPRRALAPFIPLRQEGTRREHRLSPPMKK